MERLFSFIYAYRAFLIFILLELFCTWLIIQNNQYQSTKYFNTAGSISAKILGYSQNVREYFSLREINNDLAEENALLRFQIERNNQRFYPLSCQEIKNPEVINQFRFVSAKVINNSTKYYKNYITIDRGSNDSIAPGMAVISAGAVAGKVKSVSEHYAVLMSLLNIDNQISCTIKRVGYYGTAQWDGTNSRRVDLKYIPRHVEPAIGDTIVTSGYNAVFPPGILLGVIKEMNLRKESQFYDLRVEPAIDFGKLAYVEVVKSFLKAEKDSLEIQIMNEPK